TLVLPLQEDPTGKDLTQIVRQQLEKALQFQRDLIAALDTMAPTMASTLATTESLAGLKKQWNETASKILEEIRSRTGVPPATPKKRLARRSPPAVANGLRGVQIPVPPFRGDTEFPSLDYEPVRYSEAEMMAPSGVKVTIRHESGR